MPGLKPLLDKFGILGRFRSCKENALDHMCCLLGLFDVEGRKKDLEGVASGAIA